jgi:hypothetical protein
MKENNFSLYDAEFDVKIQKGKETVKTMCKIQI